MIDWNIKRKKNNLMTDFGDREEHIIMVYHNLNREKK